MQTNPLATALGMALVFGGIILAIVWIAVPFAVFGIRHRLDKLLVTAEQIRQLLAQRPQ